MSFGMRAGFSKIDITPPLDEIEAYGLGYWYQRSVRFSGVRDPLYVRALALGEGERRHVVISVDSILDTYGFVSNATTQIAAALGIDWSNVWITCTHTHSSPLIHRNDTSKGAEYGPFVTERIVQAAVDASRSSSLAEMCISSGRIPDVLYNRRPLLHAGKIAELHQPVSPDLIEDPGPVNDLMTIVQFHRQDGSLMGGLCHFGIHGVAVQCSELISSDCMGRAIQAAESEAGDVVLLHLNGPCGDIDPLLMGNDEALDEMTARLHRGITEVLKAEKRAVAELPSMSAVSGSFRARRRTTRTPDVLEHEKRALFANADLSTGDRHHSGTGYEAFLLSEEEKVAALPPEFDIPYQILTCGPVALAGIGGEVFTRSGLMLQDSCPAAVVLPVGLTGGAAGYLPLKEMYQQGGYEVACAQWCPVAPGEAERLYAQVSGDLIAAVESGKQ